MIDPAIPTLLCIVFPFYLVVGLVLFLIVKMFTGSGSSSDADGSSSSDDDDDD